MVTPSNPFPGSSSPLDDQIQDQKKEEERIKEELLARFLEQELVAFFKQSQKNSGAGDDSAEGKIHQVEAQLQAGEISVAMAVAEIAAIIEQEVHKKDVSGGIESGQNLENHMKLFLGFLTSVDQPTQVGKTEEIIDQLRQGQISQGQAVEQVNLVISAVNKDLPTNAHYPSFNADHFGK